MTAKQPNSTLVAVEESEIHELIDHVLYKTFDNQDIDRALLAPQSLQFYFHHYTCYDAIGGSSA